MTDISSISFRRARFLKSATARSKIYPGNYEDYVWRKQGGAACAGGANCQDCRLDLGTDKWATSLRRARVVRIESQTDESHEAQNIWRIDLHALEGQIAETERAIAQCEEQLQNFVSAEETQRLGQELSQKQGQVAGLHEGMGKSFRRRWKTAG